MKCISYDRLGISIGFVIGGSLIFFVMGLCSPADYCEGFLTEKGKETFNEQTTSIISLTVFPASLAIFVFFLFYRRTMYVDESLFKYSKRGKPEARKCKICGKHPLFQKYHSKKIHNLETVKLEDDFENCGCSLCYQRISPLHLFGIKVR